MQKSIFIIGAATIAASFSAISAPTSGNLNFTFQGVIPPASVVPGTWKFVDLSGSDYIPSAIPLSTVRNSDGSYLLSMVNPEIFAITTTESSQNFTRSSNINAQLASTIVSGSALNGTEDGTVTLTINGVQLDNTSKSVASVSGAENQVTLSMNAQVTLPSSSVKSSGGNISTTSAVIFSADVGSASVIG
ncbi:hypothetical protein [Photobacterium damselae]|uniref:hypothetical protein n=1 Tax=Photobacterium damselae TaxID=38293 RepID=UPI000D65FE48|nr:hypothetical protein [Photobacterium damselae]AWK84040.1 hypothetical protein BST98_18825 [Photobacterium damselae]